MKKRKSVIAVLALLAMLFTAIQPTGFADESVSITIAGKAATSVEVTYDGEYCRNDAAKPYVNWGPYAGINNTVMTVSSPESVDSTKFSKDGIIIGYTVNVEQEGVYQLDISGTDVTNLYLCTYGVSMDGSEFKSISAATAEVTKNPDHDLLYNYKTPLKYYLTPGTHSFRLQVRDVTPMASKQRYDMFINYIKFNKTSDKEAADIFVYGLDNYSEKSEGLTAARDSVAPADEGTQSGSAIRMNTPNGVFDEAGYVITYPFTVTEGGAYRITDFGGNDQWKEYLSKYEISIDDAPYTKITDMKDSIADYPFLATHMRKMQLNKRYSLKPGTHYLNIHIYEKRKTGGSEDSNVHAYFDYIRLTHETEAEGFSVYGVDDSVNNIASLTDGYEQTKIWLVNDAGKNPTTEEENSRKMISVDGQKATGTFPDSGITLDYPFYCPKEGWYSLDLIMDNKGTYFSPTELAIDGKDSVAFKDPTAHFITTTKIDGNTNKYDTDLSYFLTEGMHTLNYKVTGVAKSRNWALSFFTEANFAPIAEKDLPTEIKIKAKDPISYMSLPTLQIVTDTAGESGSDTAVRFKSTADEFKEKGYVDVVYPFNVYAAGTYDIKTVAGTYLDHGYLSLFTIGVDVGMNDADGNVIEPFDLRAGIKSEEQYGKLLCKYDTNLTCDLTPGVHYLTFRTTKERPSGGVYSFFDYVEMQLQEKPELSLEIAGEYVEKGETTFATLKAVNPRTGEIVNPEFESVVYKSSDESAATIDSERLIKAVGPGKAVITAEVTYPGGEKETVSAEVKVTVNYLYCETESFTLDGQPITALTGGTHSAGAKVNIYNNDLIEGKATVVFAAYADGTLKGVEIVSNDMLNGLETTPFELVLDNFNMDGVTNLSTMVWNDSGDLIPIAKKVSLEN